MITQLSQEEVLCKIKEVRSHIVNARKELNVYLNNEREGFVILSIDEVDELIKPIIIYEQEFGFWTGILTSLMGKRTAMFSRRDGYEYPLGMPQALWETLYGNSSNMQNR